jgi:hypothetical protein
VLACGFFFTHLDWPASKGRRSWPAGAMPWLGSKACRPSNAGSMNWSKSKSRSKPYSIGACWSSGKMQSDMIGDLCCEAKCKLQGNRFAWMVQEGVAAAWARSAVCSGLMGWLLVTSRLKQVRLRKATGKRVWERPVLYLRASALWPVPTVLHASERATSLHAKF